MPKQILKAALLAITFTSAIHLPATAQVAQSDQAWQPPAGFTQLPLWPQGAPDMPKTALRAETSELIRAPKVAVDREYMQVRDVSVPTMTVFPPKTANTGAAMVVFPGGGFRILAMDLEGTEICDWVTVQGMTCVVLKYRVPKSNHYWDNELKRHVTPKVAFALQDAQRSIRLLRSKAKELAIDPNKIGVIGFSAGGYLVAQTSNVFKSTYKAVDEVDRLSSHPDFAIAMYPGHLCREDKKFDPSLKVTPNTSPTLIVQAWDDPIDPVCNSLVYAKELNEAGVPSEIHLFAKGGHAFGLREKQLPIANWPTLVEQWLKGLGILAR